MVVYFIICMDQLTNSNNLFRYTVLPTLSFLCFLVLQSRQPSDSYAHDGGSAFSKTGPSPKSINKVYKKFPVSSPLSATADLNSCSAGSNGTPNTPPPRHSARKMMTHDEVWYQKWWMCGFTDALNLNPKG